MVGFRNNKKRWPAAVALLGMGAIGYTLGAWHGQPGNVSAQQPAAPGATAPVQPAEYSQRVVAYIHGNVPVTREDLGEFLIARQGQSKIELLVNRKIIDHACKAANVSVTPEDVKAAINEDLAQLNVDRATFVKQFLKQYNKSLYEWEEDVIKPRLLLTKLCQSQIKVGEEEIKRAFESQYGDKVQCRMILWPFGQEKAALQMYDKIRNSEAEFDAAARAQAIPYLASVGGRINPIGKAFDDDALLEKIAFKLKPKEMSELFTIPNQGTAVLFCEARLPGDATKKYEAEREKLEKMVFNRKVEKAIPATFKKMQDEAKPLYILKYGTADKDVIKAAEEELKLLNQPQAPAGAAVPLPQGGAGQQKR